MYDRRQHPDDHDIIRETSTDVKWIKENMVDLTQRVSSVEKKVWFGAGINAVILAAWELLFRK